MGAAGEPAAFDAREMLTHAIDLADIGAAAQQRAGGRLLFFKCDAGRRRDPIGRGAAGEKNEHEVIGGRLIGKGQRAFGAGNSGLVGDRVACFDHGDPLGRPPIAVTRHRHTIEPTFIDQRAIMTFRHFGEGARGLAGGEDDQASARRRVRQMRRQTARRMRRGDNGAKHGFKQFARFGGHRRLNDRRVNVISRRWRCENCLARQQGPYGKIDAASLCFCPLVARGGDYGYRSKYPHGT